MICSYIILPALHLCLAAINDYNYEIITTLRWFSMIKLLHLSFLSIKNRRLILGNEAQKINFQNFVMLKKRPFQRN